MKSKYLSFLFLIFYFFLIVQCSQKEKKISKPKNIPPLEILYKKAFENFQDGKFNDSIELFESVQKNYGYTKWAQKALLMKSYIYYENSKYIQALENLKNYKKLYFDKKELAYVEYLIAICLFEQIEINSKDQTNTYLALDQFKKIIKNYPNTVYSDDLKLKMDLINDQLAGQEMYVARYYQKRQKWIAALKRINNILENYKSTIYIDEALHRMVEINYQIGNVENAKKYAAILGYNYNQSNWYKKSYTIITNQNFENKSNKTKNTLREKLKALIN